MGYLSCNGESGIITSCDPYNWDRKNKSKKPRATRKQPQLRRFSYADLDSATNGFSSHNFLGKGSHGCVYKAVLDNGKLVAAVKRTTTIDLTTSAAKTTTSFREENINHCNNSQADSEIEILSRIRHPRLVNLLGFSLDMNHNKLIVVEFMPNGSLFDLLHSNPRPPGWSKRVRFALQIARAVEALHSSNPPIIHRDIKSSNILLDANWGARLGDFGLALRGHVEDVRIKSTPPAGTMGYLDPGYITPENLSTKSDVFSFGILLLEIISGRNAIDVNYSPPSVVDWALPLIKQLEFTSLYDTRIEPPEDPSVMRQLALLAARCVRSPAERRPSMAEVVDCLKAISKRAHSPIWDNFRKRTRKPSPWIRQEVFDAREEVVKASKHGSRTMSSGNRKVSSFQPCSDFRGKLSATDTVREPCVRSKSIGSVNEIKWDSDNYLVSNQHSLVRRRSGFTVRVPVVRLSKSRSMGVLQTTQLVYNSEEGFVFQLLRNPHLRALDVARLLVSVNKGSSEEDT